jgi:hypothetical protein
MLQDIADALSAEALAQQRPQYKVALARAIY